MCLGISLCRGLQSLFSLFILFSSHGSLSREWIPKESLRFQRDLDVLFPWQLLVWWPADCPLAFWLQVLLPSRAVSDCLPCATWFFWVSIKDAVVGLQLIQKRNYSQKWKAELCVMGQPAMHHNERRFSFLSDLVTKELWAPCLGAGNHGLYMWEPGEFPGSLVLLDVGMGRTRCAEALMQMWSHNWSGVHTASVSTPTGPHHQPCHQERLATVSSQYPNPLWCSKTSQYVFNAQATCGGHHGVAFTS